MNNNPKYRLKKDTPEFKTGSMFTRRKYEYGDYDDDCLFADISPGVSPVPAFDISLIDNFDEWFEEVKEPKKEPKWVRKQIKRIDITALNKDGESGYKYTDIEYRFIKPFYYDDTEWGVDVYAKNDTSYQRFYMDDKPDKSTYLNKVALINQLVRDGYIEIQDNPNIVWEDEKCD